MVESKCAGVKCVKPCFALLRTDPRLRDEAALRPGLQERCLGASMSLPRSGQSLLC